MSDPNHTKINGIQSYQNNKGLVDMVTCVDSIFSNIPNNLSPLEEDK